MFLSFVLRKSAKTKTRWNAPHCSQTQGISWGPMWPSPWSSPLWWISHMAGAPSSLANLDGEEKWNWGVLQRGWHDDEVMIPLNGYCDILDSRNNVPNHKKIVENRHVNTLVSDRPMWLFMRNIGMRQRFKSITRCRIPRMLIPHRAHKSAWGVLQSAAKLRDFLKKSLTFSGLIILGKLQETNQIVCLSSGSAKVLWT